MSAPAAPVGLIADDITGATDLASALVGHGLETRIAFGADSVPTGGGDAIVVALKIRSVPASEARAAALAAAHALRAAGAEQFFSKYCSTFDSTDEGNIGPIADALADVVAAPRVVHVPAYPANGRTVYLGHLFVGEQLLSDSPMRDHPLNPMRDSLVPRLLARQTSSVVELLDFSVVDAGRDAVEAQLSDIAQRQSGMHHVVADALRDVDLATIATSAAGDRLAAGGAAFGAAFAVAARGRTERAHFSGAVRAALPTGPAAILAGSLSRATREQVQAFDGATMKLGISDMSRPDEAVSRAIEFARRHLGDGPLLITTDQDELRGERRGGESSPADASRRMELSMGRIAVALEELGVRRLVVAGGETSGAVADALALQSARVGPDISVGVPWVVVEDRGLAIAFKSGNFGAPSFFADALEVAGS